MYLLLDIKDTIVVYFSHANDLSVWVQSLIKNTLCQDRVKRIKTQAFKQSVRMTVIKKDSSVLLVKVNGTDYLRAFKQTY